MKSIIIISVLITAASGFIIDSPYSIDMSTEKNVMYNSATTIKFNSMEEELNKITQCTYDYRGLRINEGCVAESEEPLICLKGELILKTFADGKEMCCCNYSKLDKE